MLDARVRKIVSSSAPDASIAFLVAVSADKERSELREITNPQARKAAIRELTLRAKVPVVAALKGYADLGLRVVNPLNGSFQLIVQGPAKAWKQAIGEHADLFDGKSVDLVPNETTFVALAQS